MPIEQTILTPSNTYIRSIQGWILIGIALLLLSYRLLPHRANLIKTPHARVTAKAPAFTIDAVTTALRAGSVRQLANYFTETVSIELPEKSDTYGKSQAEMVIRDFFSDIAISNFKVIQKGQSAGFYYCTGILMSKSGDFLTTVFLKTQGSKLLLTAIRFQESEDGKAGS